MRKFLNEELLIHNEVGVELYNHVKDLPIIDYHCHLNEYEIQSNYNFKTITELWLKVDHYKWRTMRSCGVDEKYITGDASDYEKFLAFATIMPKLIGNSVYYWAHLELKMIFGVDKQLCKDNAKEIYDICNEKLKSITTQSLLNKFKVEFLCTTDDPISPLSAHGEYSGIRVAPTFRPDRLFNLEEEYITELSKMSNVKITDIKSLKKALEARIDYFKSKKLTCKLLGQSKNYGNSISLFLCPILTRNIEGHIESNLNITSCTSNYLGTLQMIGQGAGGAPTASAVVSDLLDIYENIHTPFTFKNELHIVNDEHYHFYVRMNKDECFENISLSYENNGQYVFIKTKKMTIVDILKAIENKDCFIAILEE